MRASKRVPRALIAGVMLLSIAGLAQQLALRPGAAVEPTRVACPSLGGNWWGHFEGHASGTWRARLTQTGDTLSAVAAITVQRHGEVTATGAAQVTCGHGIARIEGTGTARGMNGRFSGVADKHGTTLHGTWSGGRLHGTWNGTR